MVYQIIVCGGIVPDPLQTLEPVSGSMGPALKNELLLPHVLDPWAAHALYEGASLAKQHPGSTVYLVSAAPKTKLQQVMMTIAQKAALQLVAVDAPSSGFVDSFAVAEALASAIQSIPDLDRSRLLVFGGWESASRDSMIDLRERPVTSSSCSFIVTPSMMSVKRTVPVTSAVVGPELR